MKPRSVGLARRSAFAPKPSPRRSLFAVNSVKLTAGVLFFRKRKGVLEVLLAHQGGPFYAWKDVWSLPKTDVITIEREGPLEAAKRLASSVFAAASLRGTFQDMGFVNHRSGTVIHGLAIEADFEPSALESPSFALEWPPASGTHERFLEIDRVEWFDVEEARNRLTAAQMPLLTRLVISMS